MPDALLDITLKLPDYGVRSRVDAPDQSERSQEVVNMLFELLHIIPEVFESVHKIRIYVGRGLLSLAETRWLRL